MVPRGALGEEMIARRMVHDLQHEVNDDEMAVEESRSIVTYIRVAAINPETVPKI